MTKWISVQDKVPEEGVNVLFFVPKYNEAYCGYVIPEINRGNMSDGSIAFWFLEHSENTAFAEKDVTHWTSLPETPNE